MSVMDGNPIIRAGTALDAGGANKSDRVPHTPLAWASCLNLSLRKSPGERDRLEPGSCVRPIDIRVTDTSMFRGGAGPYQQENKKFESAIF